MYLAGEKRDRVYRVLEVVLDLSGWYDVCFAFSCEVSGSACFCSAFLFVLLCRCPCEYGRKYGALSVMLVGYVWAVSFFSVFFMSDAQVSFFIFLSFLYSGVMVRETCTLWLYFNACFFFFFTIYLYMEMGGEPRLKTDIYWIWIFDFYLSFLFFFPLLSRVGEVWLYGYWSLSTLSSTGFGLVSTWSGSECCVFTYLLNSHSLPASCPVQVCRFGTICLWPHGTVYM